MLLRYSLPVSLIAGALALTGGVFVVVKDKVGRPAEIAMLQRGQPASMLHLMSHPQVLPPAAAEPSRSGGEVRQTSLQAENDATPTSGYFDRARILLYLLRSRHWRKAAHQDVPQTEPVP